jgi:hypothetical protein
VVAYDAGAGGYRVDAGLPVADLLSDYVVMRDQAQACEPP